MTEDAALDSFENGCFPLQASASQQARIRCVSRSSGTTSSGVVLSSPTDAHYVGLRSILRIEGIPLASEADEQVAASGEVRLVLSSFHVIPSFFFPLCLCILVGQSMRSPRTRQTWLPRATRTEARRTEFSRKDTRIPRRCAGNARAAGVVPEGWHVDLPCRAALVEGIKGVETLAKLG